MTRDVMVLVSGMQFDGENGEPVQTLSVGRYKKTGEAHRIHYEECMEGEDGEQYINQVELVIGPDWATLRKAGTVCTEMTFQEGLCVPVVYATKFGSISLEAKTHAVDINIVQDMITVKMEYSLYTEDDLIMNLNMQIVVVSK